MLTMSSIREISGHSGINSSKDTMLSENQKKEALALFDKEVPVDTIRKRYGLTRKDLGFIINSGIKPELDEKKIVALYSRAEWPIDRIGVAFCIDSSSVKRILLKNKVEIRGHGAHSRLHIFNYRFFHKIDTEEKAYWLGFLAGDGNICNRLQQVNITLNRQDREHLVKFKKSIGLVDDIVRDFDQNGRDYSSITLSSKVMALDLFEHGLTPKKSLTLAQPQDVPNDLNRHFIRGLFDADGSFLVYKRSQEISLVGSYDLLSWVSENLDGNPDPKPHKSIWRIRARAEHFISWVSFLYEDSSVFLDRKKDKALEIMEIRNATR